MSVARNLTRFIAIAIRFRQIAVKHPRLGNRPFLFERWVPGRKSVIAAGVTTCNARSRRWPVVRPSRCSRSRHLLHLVGAPGFQHLKQIRWVRIDTDCTEERPD
jgi:hypothetical protein